MATVTEKYATRSITSDTETRVYLIEITAADAPSYYPVASDAGLYFATVVSPTITISGLTLNDVSAREAATTGDGDTTATWGLFEVTAEWGPPEVSFPEGTVKTASRTSLVTVNFKHSKQTISADAATWWNGGTAEDYEGLLNVDDEGNVEGADVQVPITVYTVTKKVLSSTVNDAYEIAAHDIVGKTNSATYRTRAIGTLLCSGVEISPVDDQHSEIKAEFLYGENETTLSVGSITVAAKKAWEYIWVRSVQQKVGTRVIPQIAQANVERVYDSANFATALGF